MKESGLDGRRMMVRAIDAACLEESEHNREYLCRYDSGRILGIGLELDCLYVRRNLDWTGMFLVLYI